jgi:CBS domain containing-hemolysin-like protein
LFADVPPWVPIALGLVAIPLLITLNGFFVAAEFALVAVRKTRVEELVAQKVRRARAVQSALNHLDRSIAATQLGITLASIALGAVGQPALAALIEPVFFFLPDTLSWLAKHSVAAALAFLLITYMHVVFGEILPKAVALQASDRAALWLAAPLNVFAKLSRPLVALIAGSGNRVLRRFHFLPLSGNESVHSVEELLLLIEDTEEAGMIDPNQADIVENVFLLSNKKVRECLVPRDKMAALELSTPPEKVLEAVRQGAHTRMPVYEREIDNVVGIVNTKDLFHLYSAKGLVILDDAMYTAVFLDPDEKISTALQLFKKSRHPMAMVRDADKKILGLITLEDVLEEIVGDLEDEHDRPTPKVRLRRRKSNQ